MLDPVELFPEIPNLYQFPSVHAGMLYDEERVAKYSAAINQVVKKGDVVADIGTGTGLLAFLCLKAGAKRVHAIERSPAINWAKLIADKNGLSDRIVFHKQDSRDCNLPEKVDVVVSELIGHIAFEEGMAESLFDAKERFLATGGVIIPEKVNLRIALVEENEVYPECIDCWQDIEGVDYSLMREEAIKALYLTSLSSRDLLSEPKTFFRVNFKEKCQLNLQKSRSFNVCRSGKINGIALWFEAYLSSNVTLSSGPWSRTHWKQCFAPIARPIAVNAGDTISVNIKMNLRTKIHDFFKFDFRVRKGV
ncbi:MAG: hypothetical protein A2Y97_11275 [Nitrospirae bacterium RBG_13_39_12]|nr:MAG: hypothetical protein A2Y97_11275 [Nitrospirae bacterium RBG_13_39_12]